MAGTVARQKDNESDEVSWEEFLWVAILGEYIVAYCWPFSGTDAHPPHAIDQTNISDRFQLSINQSINHQSSIRLFQTTRSIYKKSKKNRRTDRYMQ